MNAEVVNLGFSGSGKGEPEVCRTFAGIKDPRLFVVDYEANTDFDGLQKTLPENLRILRSQHRDVPVLVVSGIPCSGEASCPKRWMEYARRRKLQKQLVDTGRKNGDPHLYFPLVSQHVLTECFWVRFGVRIPTQRLVAEACGVSRAAVGAILSGGAAATRYSAETRELVLAAAKTLRYRPNRAARAMRKQRSNLVAIVHFGAGIEAAYKTNQALSRELNVAGFDYLAVDMNWYGGSVERILEELIQARVEGVLISHIQEVFGYDHAEVLRQAGIPVVSINGESRENVSLICDSATKAIAELTTHLLALGHRQLIQPLPAPRDGNSDSRAHGDRRLGFASAFKGAGRWLQVAEEDFSMELFRGNEPVGITVNQDPRQYELLARPVYHICRRMFAAGECPDAIVCSNDSYAVEAIMAAFEVGLAVPGDLAVTGYDNDCIGEFPAIGLTTAEQDLNNICITAVRTLTDRINNPELPVITKSFDSKLIIRSSCGSSASQLS